MTTDLASHLAFDRWHAKQEAFILSPAKRKVIVAGRRGGKTVGMVNLALAAVLGVVTVEQYLASHGSAPEKMIRSPLGQLLTVDPDRAGRRVLEAAPTADQTAAFWDNLKRLVTPWLPLRQHGAPLVEKWETTRAMEFANGGRIRTKTAWDADTLRGDYADLLIMDEYSLMHPDAWAKVGAPMLLDNDGDAAFIFTPQRRNHAFALYVKATADLSARYEAWHFTSYDNPYLSKAALAEITSDMTAEDHEQEIMAEFLENEGAVFRHIARCLVHGESPAEAHADHTIVMGVDWAKRQDYTVLSVGCADCRRELYLDRFKGIDYILQRGRLATLVALFGVDYILAELNSIGEPNLELLQDEGLPAAGFETTPTSKGPLIRGLALAIEHATIDEAGVYLLDDPIAKAELEAYEIKVNPVTGRPTYSAPEGVHDDTVVARALMVRAMNEEPAFV